MKRPYLFVFVTNVALLMFAYIIRRKMQKIISVSANVCRKDLYKLLHLVEKGYLIKIAHRNLGDFKIASKKDETGKSQFQLGFWER